MNITFARFVARTCLPLLPDCDEETKKKLVFTSAALDMKDPFVKDDPLPRDVVEALEWQASRTDAEICQYRETVLVQLEAAGATMWETGKCMLALCNACCVGGQLVQAYVTSGLVSACPK